MSVKVLIAQQIHDLCDTLCAPQLSQALDTIQLGKMLRSEIILAIAGQTDSSIKLCAIVEMIHLASLLHDDVLDESEMRRGKTSFNASFGSKKAIMFGDILYSCAFGHLMEFGKDIAQSISNAVSLLSWGEYIDVDLSQSFNADEALYMDMIYKKTASLIEASTYSAALLAHHNQSSRINPKAIKAYGKNLGIAFQLTDDLLDITQDEQTLGKPAFSDFASGKVTMPYFLLLQCLSDQDQCIMQDAYGKPLDAHQIDWFKSQFHKHQIPLKCLNHMRPFVEEALALVPQELPLLEGFVHKATKRQL